MKNTPEYLTYETEAPSVIEWLLSSPKGTLLFAVVSLGLGALIGWALS